MTELARVNEKHFFDDGSYKGEIPHEPPYRQGYIALREEVAIGIPIEARPADTSPMTARIEAHSESDEAERGEE